jgi:hypothetical protein
MTWKTFTTRQKSSFTYWWWHNLAFNYTAIKCKAWKFKYLFHDIEKPFLMLLWRDYKKVQQFHRSKNKHHIEYPHYAKWDLEAMVIDWECSRLTKLESPLNALNTFRNMVEIKESTLYVNDIVVRTSLLKRIPDILVKLNLINNLEKERLNSIMFSNIIKNR